MHRFVPVLVLCALLACQSGPAATADLAITHATVVDVEAGEVLPDHTVLVEDRRISAVGPSSSIRVPNDAETVDATGLFVIPGLWDAHVHSAASVAWHFPLLIAHGVTAVRNMHSTVDTALGLTNAIKQRLAAGEVLGPRFLANGPVIDGDPPVWPGSAVARTEAEGRAVVDSLVDAGADFIKVYDRLSRAAYLGIADQARRRGVPVDGHVPFAVPLEEAAAAGQRTAEHTSGIPMGCSPNADSLRAAHDELMAALPTLSFPDDAIAFFSLVRAALESRDPATCQSTVRALQENRVAVTPTLVEPDPVSVLEDPGHMRLLPAAVRDRWVAMSEGPGDPMSAIMGPLAPIKHENVRMLHAAGVMILAGTDLGNPFLVPGISLHDELEMLVEATGLSPLDALRAATSNPARVFGMADSLGTVSTGMLADLVLLHSNPLDDVRNTTTISGVVVNGRFLDRDALDRLISVAARWSNER